MELADRLADDTPPSACRDAIEMPREGGLCPLPPLPPWAPDAAPADVAVVIAGLRGKYPHCRRVDGGGVCLGCLRDVVAYTRPARTTLAPAPRAPTARARPSYPTSKPAQLIVES